MSSVDHPGHYRRDTGHEAIDVIEAWDLGFNLGNAVKYIARAGLKGDALEDLQKAIWYIQREVRRRTPAPPGSPAYRVSSRQGKVAIKDEVGDARWLLSKEEAGKLAATLRWAVDQADSSPSSIFEDGPLVWREKLEDGLLYAEWDEVRLEDLTDDEARALAKALDWEAGA